VPGHLIPLAANRRRGIESQSAAVGNLPRESGFWAAGIRPRQSADASHSGDGHIAFDVTYRLGLCGLSLSRLNRPPHTIAVYASPRSSPSATQHSLPGGRYPLPGPDFHRLDRASFAWRTRNGNSTIPRGRHPDGEHTLSNAQRQARYRARREAEKPAPVVRYRRPVDRRSRLQRWNATRSRGYSPCKLNMPPGATLCRTVSATLPPLRPYRPSSISISMNSPPSCHRADTVAIDAHMAGAPPGTTGKIQ
jgi:hypothetical protein